MLYFFMLRHRAIIFLFCFFLVSFYCSVSSAETIEKLVVDHGPRNSEKIALTFDACPTGRTDEYDEAVIDILLREKVRATLFMSGRWVEKNPDKAKFLAGRPQFEIAAHSYYHPHMLEKTDDRDIREFARTQAEIRKVTGITPKYFRPPYGEVDERVAQLAAKAGLVTVEYDIASGDPDPNLSPQRIARVVLRDARGGSIVVFHMNKNGVHTAEVLPEVISGLRKKGFTLVTVSELLQEKQRVATEARSTLPAKKSLSHPVALKASHLKHGSSL
jgi:peptidoglycan/xylan/chitin deacetylase (PgdA/CDA1 family)